MPAGCCNIIICHLVSEQEGRDSNPGHLTQPTAPKVFLHSSSGCDDILCPTNLSSSPHTMFKGWLFKCQWFTKKSSVNSKLRLLTGTKIASQGKILLFDVDSLVPEMTCQKAQCRKKKNQVALTIEIHEQSRFMACDILS